MFDKSRVAPVHLKRVEELKLEFGDEVEDMLTEEDMELIWLPAFKKVLHCPKCDSSAYKELFIEDRNCAGSWYGRVRNVYTGNQCIRCAYVGDWSTFNRRIEKDYNPYMVYLVGNMGNLDIEWFDQNNSHDIRDYPHRRKLSIRNS